MHVADKYFYIQSAWVGGIWHMICAARAKFPGLGPFQVENKQQLWNSRFDELDLAAGPAGECTCEHVNLRQSVTVPGVMPLLQSIACTVQSQLEYCG